MPSLKDPEIKLTTLKIKSNDVITLSPLGKALAESEIKKYNVVITFMWHYRNKLKTFLIFVFLLFFALFIKTIYKYQYLLLSVLKYVFITLQKNKN